MEFRYLAAIGALGIAAFSAFSMHHAAAPEQRRLAVLEATAPDAAAARPVPRAAD